MRRMMQALSALSLCLAACDGQVKFSSMDLGSKQTVTEPTTPTVDPVYKKTSGSCSSDSSTAVVSCMKCEIPTVPPAEPPMSLKAKQLMNIMAAVCPINRAYYGNKYAATTIADHLAKLNRCSTALYPASTPDAGQNDVVQRLLNNDTALQNKMFTGLWYKPPYSDYFETYFGLEVGQAIQVFCEQSVANISGMLVPSSTAPNPYGPVWEYPDPMPDMYVKANDYRDGLSACISLSKTSPWQAPPPVAAKACNYETLAGAAGDQINSQVSSWLAAGYTVGADMATTGVCSSVKSLDDIKSYQGDITVGAYICK